MYTAPALERYGTLRELTEHDESSCLATVRNYSGGWNVSYEKDEDDDDEHHACMSR
jgi:hypothetical protein